MSGLEPSNQPDPSKRWVDFKDVFLQNAFKTIKWDVARYKVDDHYVLKIIKERHRHKRENYKKKQNPVLDSQNCARMCENGRMESVSFFFSINILIYINIGTVLGIFYLYNL